MDVEYLRANSRVQSSLIFVDSSTRDRSVWPDPAEFTIVFDQPYTNVVSMTVLDATIPSTMYVVDRHNDHMRFFVRTSGSEEVLAGLRAALSALEDFPPVRNLFADLSTPERRLKFFDGALPPPQQQQQEQEQEEQQGAASGDPSALGVFRNAYGLLREGEGLPPETTPHLILADSATLCGAPPTSSVFRGADGAPRALLEIVSAATGGSGYMFSAPYGCWSPDDEAFCFPGENTAYALSLGPDAGGFSLVSYTSAAVPPGAEGGHLHEIAFFNVTIEAGNYDPPGFSAAFQHAMPPDPARPSERKVIDIGSPSKIFLKETPEYMKYSSSVHFTSPYPFWFDMESSEIKEVLGFTGFAEDGNNAMYSRLLYRGNRRIFGALPIAGEGATIQQTSWRLTSPGTLNLNGIRFVILRCPQIEGATPSLSAQNYSAGLGLFKLYDQTLSHLRFDFVKLDKADFHPIGKLSRLHLRLERLGGEMYDFKGADFHIVLVINYMEPARPHFTSERLRKASRSSALGGRHLNPDYDPDVLRYISRTRRELDESETDSDASLLGDDEHLRRFLARRAVMASRAHAMGANGGGEGGDDSPSGPPSGSASPSGPPSPSGSGSPSGSASPSRSPSRSSFQ